jgi:hypothetical protein
LSCTNGTFLILFFVLRLSCRPGLFFAAPPRMDHC